MSAEPWLKVKKASSLDHWARINSIIKPREAQFYKTVRSTFFWLRRQPRDLQSVRLGAYQKKNISGFFWHRLLLLNSLKKWCFTTQQLFRSLSTGVVSASSRALWRVYWNKVIWVPGHYWFDTPHVHTSDGDSLFFQSCLFLTVTVTPSRIMSIEVFLSESVDHIVFEFTSRSLPKNV